MRNRNRFDKDINHEQMDRAFKEISQMAKDYVPPTDKDKYYIKMFNKQTLQEIFSEIGNFSGVDVGQNDKNSTHSYLETYDRLFEPYRSHSSILEIGLASGDSIKLWDRYFDNSRIVGVDLSIVFVPEERKESTNIIYLISADATKPDIVEKINSNVYADDRYSGIPLTPMFDIILDDGSHVTQDQIDTFNLLKGNMRKHGLYIIEDILALDQEREKYLALHDNCEIIDMRSNGRFDNALILYKF